MKEGGETGCRVCQQDGSKAQSCSDWSVISKAFTLTAAALQVLIQVSVEKCLVLHIQSTT